MSHAYFFAPARSRVRTEALAFLLTSLGCMRQSVSVPPGERFEAGPILVERDPPLNHTFQVRNTTGRRVRIIAVEKSCSCTEVELNKRELAPGESTEMKLRAMMLRTFADMTLSCVLTTDSEQFPRWEYEFHFRCLPRMMAYPERVEFDAFRPSGLNADGTARGGIPTQWSHIDVFGNTTDRRLFVPQLQPSDDGPFRLNLIEDGPIEILGGGLVHQRYKLGVRVDSGASLAKFPGESLFAVRGPQGESVTVTAAMHVLPSVEVIPSRMSFGSTAGGQGVRTKKLIVRSPEGRAFRIRSISMASPDSGAKLVESRHDASRMSATHQLEITLGLPPCDRTSVLSGTLRIECDGLDRGVIEVPWSVFIRPSRPAPATESVSVSPKT